MVLDELIYDSSNGIGSMNLSMLEGVFSFTSGEIAKIGPDSMKLKTPVVTCGIRGTTVAGKAAVEGNENSFTLLQDADGGVGQISLTNAAGTQVLGQVGATTNVVSFTVPPPPPVILSATQIQANYGTALNVLPPTPLVAPTPREQPSLREEQQEEALDESSEEQSEQEEQQEEALDESSEEQSDEALAEEVSEEGEEGEEALIEEELLEAEESLLAGEDVLAEEETSPPEEGGPALEEGPPEGDQQAARESFDTALAAGASPEQAMAEAAVIAGFDGPVAEGGPTIEDEPLGGLDGQPLGDIITGALGSRTDPLAGSPFTPSFTPSLDGPASGSPLAPGFMNAGQGPVMGPIFGMRSVFGPISLDTMAQGPLGFVSTMPEIFGSIDFLSSTENQPEGTFFFDDPSLYDDFKSNNQQLDSSDPILTGIIGTSSNDNLIGTNDNDTIHGLEGDDTLDGGAGIDTLNGGLGNDKYIIDNINDVVNENIGEGTDTIESSVTYTLSNDIENLTLTGSSNINATGNELNNVIIGNSGTNELSGGLGNDIFYLNGASSFGDTIKDFSINDELRFNLTFDIPTTQYSVTRSHFYEHSSSSRLTYNSSSNSNELPYIFNFTEDTSSYLTKSFKSDVVSSIRYTKATSGNGTEHIFIVGNGTDSAIWLWDDTSQGYGVGNSELTFIAELENFDNDTLSASNIVLGTI